ncbi:MAG: hypothetical protein AAFS07_18975 [Pseudomonadota bacterium]
MDYNPAAHGDPAVPLISVKAMEKYGSGDRGTPMIVACYSYRCGHCHKLYPALVAAARQRPGTRFAIFHAAKHRDASFPSIRVDGEELSIARVVVAYPTLLVLDGRGTATVYRGDRDIAGLTALADSMPSPIDEPAQGPARAEGGLELVEHGAV